MKVNELIKNEAQFLSLTSLYPSEYEELLTPFSHRWYQRFKHFDLQGKRRVKPLSALRLAKPSNKLAQTEDKLFFILYFLKNNHLQQSLGAQFGIDQGHISRWIKLLLPILNQSIIDLHLQPARTMDELVSLFRNRQRLDNHSGHQQAQSLHLDATERTQQRNKDQQAQRHDFSGKMGAHTLKNTVLCDEFQFVHFTGFTHRGAISDKAMVEDELPSFEALRDYWLMLTKDKGYQAYEPSGIIKLSPYKAARNHPLKPLQKLTNTWMSSIRIVCEHAISGIKRCRLVKEKIRYFDPAFRDQVFFVACGLHNLRVSRRNIAYARSASRTRARINLDFL